MCLEKLDLYEDAYERFICLQHSFLCGLSHSDYALPIILEQMEERGYV